MELLTGKALSDFDIWLISNHEYAKRGMAPFNSIAYMVKYVLPDDMVYTKVIEWIDSVGVYVEIQKCNSCFSYCIKDYNSIILHDHYYAIDTRHEATKQAIIHANKIYNER